MKKNLKLYNIKMIIILFFILIATGLETIGNIFIGKAINSVLTKDVQLLITNIAFVLMAFSVEIVIAYFCSISWKKYTQSLYHDIRIKYTEIIMSLNINSKVNSTEKNVNHLVNNINLLDSQFYSGIYRIIWGGFGMIFPMIALANINLTLALLAYGLSIVTIFLPRLLKKILHKTAVAVSDNTESFTKAVDTWFTGFPDLFWNNSGNLLLDKIHVAAKKLESALVQQAKIIEFSNGMTNSLRIISQLLILGAAGFLATKDFISIGEVTSSTNLSFQLFGSIGALSTAIPSVISGTSIIKIYEDFFSKYDTSVSSKNNKVSIHKIKSIVVKDVQVTFSSQGKKIKLPNIMISENEKVAIIGDSGRGKSTLFKLLTLQVSDFQGEITINNQPITSFNQQDLPSFITIIDQNSVLFPGSVLDNITLFDKSSSIESEESPNLLTFGGMSLNFDRDIKKLSSGEKQSVVLHRVIHFHKPLILIDEGSSAMDKVNARKHAQTLLALKDSTIIYITHTTDLELLEQFDQVIDFNALDSD
jgi:ABC-type multidrug transport system fused ATPase/permease subunit